MRDDRFIYPGILQGGIKSANRAHSAVDAQIDLGEGCSTITFVNDAGASNLFINLNNAAADSTMFKLSPGAQFSYVGPVLQKFHVISSGAVGSWNYIAY